MIIDNIKEFYRKKHEQKYVSNVKDNKKYYNIFTTKADSYLPILVLGAGTNTYPLMFLKSGFDIRVIDFNQDLIKKYQENINDDGYYYKNASFAQINELYSEKSFSGVWIDDSLIYQKHSEVLKLLEKIYYLLDDEGYIFIKIFNTLTKENVAGFEIEPCSQFQFSKMLNQVNKNILANINKDKYIDFHQQLKDVVHYDILKYSQNLEIKKYDKAQRVASIIIRKSLKTNFSSFNDQ